MKKMPKPLYLCLFLIVIGALSALCLSSVNLLTEPIIAENAAKELQEKMSEVGVHDAQLVDANYIDGVMSIYKGTNESKVLYAMNIQQVNSYATVEVLIVIDEASGQLVDIVVSSQATSHGMDKKFTNNDFGVVGSKSSDYADKFINVTSATVSSNSVKMAISIAFEQFDALSGGNQAVNEFKKQMLDLGYTEIEQVTGELVSKIRLLFTAKLDSKQYYVMRAQENIEYGKVVALIAIDKTTGALSKLVVASGGTTEDREDAFVNHDFQVIGSTSADYASDFSPVAGSTVSSNALKALLDAAFVQYDRQEGDE